MTGTETDPTWGIEGTHFLWGYGIACALVAVAILWQWQRLRGRPGYDDADLEDQDLYELAMLAAGPQLAITSAATQLHHERLLKVGPADGTLATDGELGPDPDPLEQAVFEAVRARPGIASEQMREQVAAGEAVAEMTTELTEHGLLLPEQQRKTLIRRMGFAGLLLTVVGAVRFVAGLIGDQPVLYLGLAVLAVFFGTIWLIGRVPHATARGSERLARWRAQNADLRGFSGLSHGALAVALFGGAALWLAAPEFASALGVERESAAGGGGGGGGGCGGGCGGCGGGCGG